jgi:hypothetical protein
MQLLELRFPQGSELVPQSFGNPSAVLKRPAVPLYC